MFASRFSLRGRRRAATAVSCLCLLSLILFLAACTTQSATVAEPTVVEPTLPPPTETAVPPTETSEPVEVVIPTEVPLASPLAAELDKWLREQKDKPPFRGAALVAVGDEIVLSQGYGLADTANNIPNTADTEFSIGVLTKPITAVAIMQLYEQGLLNVNDPICNYVDECPRQWEEINIGHLLGMTSGIPDYRDMPDYAKMKATPMTPDQLLAPVKDAAILTPPGKEWMPGDSGYIILGQIIERVSGQSFADYLQGHVFDPAGMTKSGVVPAPEGAAVGYRINGQPAGPVDAANMYAASGVYSTVGDLYLWTQALRDGRLISQTTLDEMFSKHFTIAPNFHMGYGWAVDSPINGHGINGNTGTIDGHSEFMGFFPDEDVTIIALLNEEREDPFDYGEELASIVFAGATE